MLVALLHIATQGGSAEGGRAAPGGRSAGTGHFRILPDFTRVWLAGRRPGGRRQRTGSYSSGWHLLHGNVTYILTRTEFTTNAASRDSETTILIDHAMQHQSSLGRTNRLEWTIWTSIVTVLCEGIWTMSWARELRSSRTCRTRETS